MAILRVVILAIGIALGTILVAWWVVPVVGGVYGVVMHRTPRPGLTAALAGGVGWGGYLLLAAAGGGGLVTFAGALARSMQLPSWALWSATLLFPALLAGTAAYLGARAGGRYLTPA